MFTIFNYGIKIIFLFQEIMSLLVISRITHVLEMFERNFYRGIVNKSSCLFIVKKM